MPPYSARWAIFLDIDGTLLEHAAHPEAVRVDSAMLALLAACRDGCGGALALISGRSVAAIDALFAPLELPAAGQHGHERRGADGAWHRSALPVESLARAASQLVRFTAAHEGLVLENKGLTLALHFRQAPALAAIVEGEARRLAAELGPGFELQEGKFVFEIKPGGRDKGSAIDDFLAEPPFASRLPVFLGDDLTDEFGFDLVNRVGGHSVKVGPGPTRARWNLPDAPAVRRWLGEYVAFLKADSTEAAR